MIFYYLFSAVLIAVQLLVLVEAYRHLIFTIRKYQPKISTYRPKVAMIAPCKGLDTSFDRNIQSFFAQDYSNYSLYFVVESTDDPAFARLQNLIAQHKQSKISTDAHVWVAGIAETNGQKVHNLLAGVDAASDNNADVFVFVDSDACLKKHFLTSMVHPLRRKDIGASTGYRWYVPTDKRLSSKVLSAMNAYIASLLGPHPWNSVWGGAMAIRKDRFELCQIRPAWQQGCSDDYALTRQVKKTGLAVAFVPACFVASYDQMDWKTLVAFARRQFILTRLYYPSLWWLGITGLGHYLLGFWLGTALTAIAWRNGSPLTIYVAILPAFLWLTSMVKAAARQIMIRKILPEDRAKLFWPGVIDLLAQPLIAAMTLACLISTAGTRTMLWRGFRYVFKDPDHIEMTRITDDPQAVEKA